MMLAWILGFAQPALASELPSSGDGWAVRGSSLAGGAVVGAAGAAAGLGLGLAACDPGATECWVPPLVGVGTGALGGYALGSLGAGTWMARRRGLDPSLGRRRALMVMGASGALMLAAVPTRSSAPLILGGAAMAVGVPMALGSAGPELSVGAYGGEQGQGLVVSGRF